MHRIDVVVRIFRSASNASSGLVNTGLWFNDIFRTLFIKKGLAICYTFNPKTQWTEDFFVFTLGGCHDVYYMRYEQSSCPIVNGR